MPSLIYTSYVSIINNSNIVVMQILIRDTELRPQLKIQWKEEITLFQEGELQAPVEGNGE